MLLLHIGPHKTATTYIQQNLFANQEFLAEKGWVYPELGTSGMSGHHNIAHDSAAFLDGAQTKALADLGTSALAANRNIVLSAEGFCRWTPQKFQQLAQVLGQDQVHLVYTVRDPFDVLYSYWAEEVKQGYSVSFSDRFIENIAHGVRSRLMNPMRDLAPHLAAQFARISVVPYNVIVADGVDIFDHFCQSFLGLADVPKADARPKNTAMPIEVTEFLRLVTNLRSNGAAHIGSDLRHRFMAATTPKDRRDIEALMRKNGGPARRVLTLDGIDVVKRRLEAVAQKGLAGLWSYPVEGRTIYKDTKQEFVYYDAFMLWQIAPIRAAAEKILEGL